MTFTIESMMSGDKREISPANALEILGKQVFTMLVDGAWASQNSKFCVAFGDTVYVAKK